MEDSSSSSETNRFEVFFDGACPLCKREIDTLRRLDRKQRVRFTDISDANFDGSDVGVGFDTLMARIHGRMPDGSLVEGVEVFRQIYARVGFSPLVMLTRIPGISHGLDLAYRIFAKNRLRLTGRCTTDSCALPDSGTPNRQAA